MEGLLSFYAMEWIRFTTAAGYIHRVFKYLNRHWVKREVDEGRKSVYDVYTVNCLLKCIHLYQNVNGIVSFVWSAGGMSCLCLLSQVYEMQFSA